MTATVSRRPALKVYAEVATRGCLLFTFDPPGLLARGESLDEALASGPAEARKLRSFLAECGELGLLTEVWAPDEAPELVVAETFSRRGRADDGNTWATFERDLEPVRPKELPGLLAILGHLREALLTLRDRLPPEAYGYRSLPRRMSIGEQLRHVYACDRWYLSCFWPGLPATPRAADLWGRLERHRRQALDHLAGLSQEDMAAVRRPNRQVWTARKLFRRFMYHEKFHRDTIERDLALFLAQRGQ
ncbi:MAG TPA: DinB family protein [Bacillota bacterium]|jgi:uncharacterized damage-inducible protein DinB